MLILDGPMGTELQRLGYSPRPPNFGAGALRDCPERVAEVHCAYAQAGAQALTTNTFGLTAASVGDVRVAVELARAHVGDGSVVGAIAPCDPGLPHTEQAAHARALGIELVRQGVDVLFAQTHVSLAGARIAVRELHQIAERAERRVAVWTGLVFGADGRTLSGERLDGPLEGAHIAWAGCTEHAALPAAIEQLARHHAHLGALPNAGRTIADRFEPSGASVNDILDTLAQCHSMFGLQAAGGCCGTTPAFIRQLYARFKQA